MSYYVVKTSFESGEVNKNGDPVYKKAEFLVSGESVLDVETKMAEYLDGSVGGFETTQVTKSKIEAVVGN
jgi:hypothetical protein|tara:strand:- start:271 stop:480 length:210 start_codon:yes stop_codon:yes gene_type:complete